MSEQDRREEPDLDPAEVAPTDNSTGAPVDLDRVADVDEAGEAAGGAE